MPTNMKYSLTRLCLRGGQMTLSPKLMALFADTAEGGKLSAFDTVKNVEYELELKAPRTLLGLGPFFDAHGMDVNDQVVIARQEGRIALTPIVHPKEPAMSDADLAQLLAYKVLELNAPLSAAELKELFPHLPKDADVDRLLMSDNRLVKMHGRWLPRRKLLESEAPPEPESQDPDEARPAEPAAPPHRVTVTPYPRGVMFPGETGEEVELLDLSLNHRARTILRDFGFRVESLSHAQFLAHADLGRHHYTVLVHIHPEEARLDWAALLSRRRESQATYVAVFGRQEDLMRLVSPAELARATLWSWDGLERAHAVLRSLPLSSFDLEPHFKREGLFTHGLERFEATIAGRVAERGNYSAVLGRLANLRAPSIFLLEDVVADLDVPRDQVVKVLETLAQPPMQMIAKVDDGEFCLRHSVSQGLLQLSDYALSLRERLPDRRHERLQGIPEEEEEGENASPNPEEEINAK